MELTPSNHDTDVLGLRYVYAVYSRRAGGVSVGVDLNPNHACNWRCIYCQVENLVRGAAPPLDLERLEHELDHVLGDATDPAWLADHVPEGGRRLVDVALAGNGEPTTSPQLDAVLAVIAEALDRRDLGTLPIIVISNGSQVHKPSVQAALRRLAERNGELWYKLDGGTPEARRRLNDVETSDERVIDNLVTAADLVRTRIQTMVLALDGAPPTPAEVEAYLATLDAARARGARIASVLVYGPARESSQPEATRIEAVPADWLAAFGERVRAAGYEVSLHP